MGKEENEVWVEVVKEGLAGPVTWILFLKCLQLSACGLDRDKGFSLVETSCAGLTFNQSSAPLLFHHLLPYYQSDCVENRDGMEEGKSGMSLTQHMCVCLKIVWRAKWGLFLLMRAQQRHTLGSPADAWEWGRLHCGMWFTDCLFLLSVFTYGLAKDLIFGQQCCWQVLCEFYYMVR